MFQKRMRIFLETEAKVDRGERTERKKKPERIAIIKCNVRRSVPALSPQVFFAVILILFYRSFSKTLCSDDIKDDGPRKEQIQKSVDEEKK